MHSAGGTLGPIDPKRLVLPAELPGSGDGNHQHHHRYHYSRDTVKANLGIDDIDYAKMAAEHHIVVGNCVSLRKIS